jgi:hypothetical protein
MRDFLNSVQLTDVIKGVDARAKPTMETENLVFYDRG